MFGRAPGCSPWALSWREENRLQPGGHVSHAAWERFWAKDPISQQSTVWEGTERSQDRLTLQVYTRGRTRHPVASPDPQSLFLMLSVSKTVLSRASPILCMFLPAYITNDELCGNSSSCRWSMLTVHFFNCHSAVGCCPLCSSARLNRVAKPKGTRPCWQGMARSVLRQAWVHHSSLTRTRPTPQRGRVWTCQTPARHAGIHGWWTPRQVTERSDGSAWAERSSTPPHAVTTTQEVSAQKDARILRVG